MSTDWTGKTWRIVTPGCGLSSGDVLRFVNSDIQVKPSGSAAFEAAWGTYSNGSSSGCAAQAYGASYTIRYDDLNRDTLVCASTSFGLFLSQSEGPNGPSWTAEEGG